MKKLILTSATVFLVGISVFAQDGGNCTKNCKKKCETRECSPQDCCKKQCSNPSECTASMKCTKSGKVCVTPVKSETEKRD